MKSTLTIFAVLIGFAFNLEAQDYQTCENNAQVEIIVENTHRQEKKDFPVIFSLKNYPDVQQAIVMDNDREIASQMDDLDRDGFYDELCFLVDLNKKEKKKIKIELLNQGEPRCYKSRTYAEIVMRNPKIKEKNKHDLYLSEIGATKDLKDPYHLQHHHGVAFESELVAARIFFDKRQTLDLYGKRKQGLELKETQFYTTREQKEQQGFGDDVLWVGNTFGLGALRGWDGKEPTMIDDVQQRIQRIIATGPVRTIVEMEDKGWKIADDMPRVNATIRYTLYGGHRDIDVDVYFNRNTNNKEFSTGLVNVKTSEEFTDTKGLRGCWGTAYPSSEKDSVDHPLETIGLGIFIPKDHLVKELPADKDNYGFVIKPVNKHIHYKVIYTVQSESFGCKNKEEWFEFLKAWKKRM